jgi:CxC2 like cysteine cluster associated with KDZ transposases
MLCHVCMREAHIYLPFHHIERWEDGAFLRTTLADLGHQVTLGHHGQQCPAHSLASFSMVNIVHTNGIHSIGITYCCCPNTSSLADQLVQHQIFPATEVVPCTVFTFEVLQYFQMLNMGGKTAMHDYIYCLQMLTDPVALHLTLVCHQVSGIHLLADTNTESSKQLQPCHSVVACDANAEVQWGETCCHSRANDPHHSMSSMSKARLQPSKGLGKKKSK